MAVFNTFTFDGENSLDYGVYITGEAVYNAPERAVEMVSIPGKNGALALDQGRFENIEVTYPAGTFGVKQTEFAGRMRAFRNMLASRYNYVRLTDSYHPDEYRLGLYKSGLEATPVAMSSAGEFDITFNCKPQRFLTSGEEPVDTSELGGDVTTDKIPYLFRRSGGGTIGHDFDAEIDKIIGGTVAWNQLFNFANAPSTITKNGVTFTKNNNGSYTINGTASSVAEINLTGNTNVVAGHKYAVISSSPCQYDSLRIIVWRNGSSVVVKYIGGDRSSSPIEYGTVFEAGAWNNIAIWYQVRGGITVNNITNSITFIDLTALFGSAEIADYVYSLEQTTSGAGVAWLKSHGFLTKDYYAYNEGSLLSVKTSAHKTTGGNVIDVSTNESGAIDASGNEISNVNFNRTELIPVTGKYKFITSMNAGYVVRIHGYNSSGVWTQQIATFATDGQFLVGDVTIPSEVRYVRISYPLVGIDNTTFEEVHSYPLDPNLELRGLFKLDANNNLYADGDEYESSGAVTRKYGYRAYQSGDESLTDAITDGTNTVYKLTTPTTEQADPYANPQIVNPLGTEEYVDTRDVPVPVGHETMYGMSQLVLSNPTAFPSKPLLEVTGVGTFWLGDTLFTITGTAGQTIYIDCETGEAWKNVGGIITPANGLVTLNRLDFPELDPGDTPVMYGTGITKVVVTPRWWII